MKAAEFAIEKIEKGAATAPGAISGLTSANTGLAAALRVVQSSDRAIPSQALDLYRQAQEAAKAQIDEWTKVKRTQLAKLNEALGKAGIPAIQTAAQN